MNGNIAASSTAATASRAPGGTDSSSDSGFSCTFSDRCLDTIETVG